MKNIIGWFTVGLMGTIGHKVGKWLWGEVLENKMNNFKNRLKSKKEES